MNTVAYFSVDTGTERRGMQARHPPAIPQPDEAKLLVEIPVAERPGPPPGILFRKSDSPLALAVQLPLKRPEPLWGCPGGQSPLLGSVRSTQNQSPYPPPALPTP
jgi:hypothetical protein